MCIRDRFYDVSDVDTYLKLLSKTPEYFQSIIEFEKAKSEAGLFMASYSADDIMKECQAFIDKMCIRDRYHRVQCA